MGCYLSSPDNNVYVTEGRGKKYAYATASCQGWRRDQEDAEAVIPDFEEDGSLFVLCDGHGGAEVAQYTVEHFPEFLKEQPLYKEGKYKEALEQAFIDFDALLRTPEVQKELIKLSLDGTEKKSEDGDNESADKAGGKENLTLASNGSSNQSSGSSSSSAIEPTSSGAGVSSEEPSAGPSASSSAGPLASSSAGPSTSRSSEPLTVVEDVDSETLRKEAEVPLQDILVGYTGKRGISGSGYSASPVIKAPKDKTEPESSEDPQPSSSKSSSSSGFLDLNNKLEASGAATDKKEKDKIWQDIIQQYFPQTLLEKPGDLSSSSDDDSEFDESAINASDSSGSSTSESEFSDEDDDDDDDDEDDDEGEDEDDDDEEDEEEDDDDEDESEDDQGEDEVDDVKPEEGQAEGADQKKDKGDKKSKMNKGIISINISKRLKKRSKKSNFGSEDDRRIFLTKQVVEKLQLGSKMQSRQHTPGFDSGCTVVVVLVKDNKLYAASAGDSRCILIKRSGDCIPMSIDHKPEDRHEYERIILAGGEVIDGRVNSGLNLSRAFGDFSYKNEQLPASKQMITPCPDVRVATIDPENLEYIFLACDGIWNSMNNNQTSRFLMKAAETTGHNLVDMCIQLFRNCIAPKTDGDGTGCDNMTCILVRLDKPSAVQENETVVESNDKKQDLNLKEDNPIGTEPNKEVETNQETDNPHELATTNTIKRSNSSSGCVDMTGPKRRCLRL